ncbi:hypothetical protein LJR016_004340 [Devosia sp. LjRoot16]|uniref:hypothetical protein n=1 Tax=Devosia sp. LjRoot16 TaxID=3342271 RepID=UPI003ED03667
MSTSVSPSDQIKSLKRTCPFFTAHDISQVTGFRLGTVERALRDLPQENSDRMPVYAMREIAD